ncbi:latent-transforming growth factor beta-binding protein 2 isoform X3 [Pleurodeles waltl]|uniref:latent-transforming growth factor beta-binding protein 2 isoform X3 n=1 Tax=Pleurodeles waltl TaxID=8319 RepID=UPI0037096E34
MHSWMVSCLLVTCTLLWGFGVSQRDSTGGANPLPREQAQARLRVQTVIQGQIRDPPTGQGKTYSMLRGAGNLGHGSPSRLPQSSPHARHKNPSGVGINQHQDIRVLSIAQHLKTTSRLSQQVSQPIFREKAGLSSPEPLRPESSPNQLQEGRKLRQVPRSKVTSQRPRFMGPNVCGGQCCSGWTTALGTGRCIKPVCAPPCQNKGSCSRPQTCVCRSGFQGPRCEHAVPEQEYRPRSAHRQAPGAGSPLRISRHKNSSSAVQGPTSTGSQSSPQKITEVSITPQQHSGSSRTVRWYPSGGSHLSSNALPNGHEQKRVRGSLRDISLPGSALTPWGANLTERIGRIKIVFTPTICKQTCSQGHCFNYCEKGATTTLYSQAGHNSDPKTGFRIYFCQIPCLNGGRCVGRDECWCPSNSTGKFCHLPAPKPERKEAGAAEAGTKPQGDVKQTMITLPLSNQLGPFSPSLVNVHINHPPEANVQVHQVARVRGDQSAENSVEVAVQQPEPQLQPGHGTSRGRWNENSIAGGSRPQQGHQDTLGTCFLESVAGRCGLPLPGLTRQEDCCGSVGIYWGVNRCMPCTPKPAHPVIDNGRLECPGGFKRLNQTHCQDINECLLTGLCKNAECVNTRGSYRCSCSPGFILDTSQRSCVSDKALSAEEGPCFRSLGGNICSLALSQRITKQLCCCSRVGRGWGRKCERCPLPGTDVFKEICPAGHGYTYSRDDIQLSMREDDKEVSLTSEELEVARSGPPSWTSVRQQLQESLGSVTGSPTLAEDATTPVKSVLVIPTPRSPLRGILESKPPVNAATQPTEIDRCAVFPNLCGAGTCMKRPGGYTCLCHPGFRLSTGRTRCIDVNECDSPHVCQGGRCINTLGSYRCECDRGYTRVWGGHCEDVDECQYPSSCPGDACINTPGSYECLRCAEGYRPSSGKCLDEDECANVGFCIHGQCINTDGSYQCSCFHGYKASDDVKSCEDINECESLMSCHQGLCVNTDGSFICTKCQAGYKLSADRDQCEDMDECSLPSVCSSGICTNTLGSFSCQACEEGYQITADRLMCRDIDECADPASNCHGGDCINTPGSYTCLCQSGFELINGTHCEDINECLTADVCGPNGECLNSNGSYFCLCATGYSNAAGGVSCEDVDECSDESSCTGGQCLNSEGSYRCICDSGFRHSAETLHCVDVDECSDYGDAVCGSWRCQNTLGSYRCLMGCQPGFNMVATAGGACVDIDECDNQTLCGSQSFCQNTEGSYRCLCDRGYELNPQGTGCIDMNECEMMVAVCGTALCENVEGSFLCLCINDNEEYHPESGRCQRREGNGGALEMPILKHLISPERKECYYNINHQHLCENVLARNTTKEECCCTEGAGWGDNCETHPCPIAGTDADECAMFSSEICSGGQCVNTVPGYNCFCQPGLYYDSVKLECVDHDECGNPNACKNGECVNTPGSYHCFCSPPLVLDVTQKQCINATNLPEDGDEVDMLDMHIDICWQRVETSYICSEPLQGRPTTYTECCCLYGEAWSQQCALCPPPASVEFAELCNIHRGSELAKDAGLRDRISYEYGPDLEDSHLGLFGPDLGVGPYYNYYGAPDSTFGSREQGRDYRPSVPIQTPQLHFAEQRPQERGDQMGHYEGFEGLRAEECGILNGCENGRCVRVREGYTCDCFDGFELELTRLLCIDINECERINNGTSLCQNGQCKNTEGSYHCVCLPGYMASQQPHQCIPHKPQSLAAEN